MVSIIENNGVDHLHNVIKLYLCCPESKMVKMKLLLSLSLLLCAIATAQVGVNTTTPQAILDVTPSNAVTPSNTDGILIPRINNFPAANPTVAQQSMLVYLSVDRTNVNINGTPQDYNAGFYYWDNTIPNWVPVASDSGWKITGNNNVTSGTHFIGTTNNQEVDFRVNNKFIGRLTELGQFELEADDMSVFIGFEAGEAYDPVNTAAEHNTFLGYQAGRATNSGRDNTAMGTLSLTNNTSGNFNTGVGDETLENNTTGEQNTAVGNDGLRQNTSGNNNSSVGHRALDSNTTGLNNTAVGYNAGETNVNGNNNVYVGADAKSNGTGYDFAVAVGNNALINGDQATVIGNNASADTAAIAIGPTSAASGNQSTAIGSAANSTGTNDIAIGTNAVAIGFAPAIAIGSNASSSGGSISIGENTNTSGANSIGIGNDVITAGSNSLAIGGNAQVGGSNSVAIGRNATTTGSNSVALGSNTTAAGFEARIGSSFVNSIGGYANWSNISDGRFKFNIEENIPGIDFINKLRPVTYKLDRVKLARFKGQKDIIENYSNEEIESGFIAQEVERIAQEIGYNFNGIRKPKDLTTDNYTVSYASFIPSIVQAIQEQQEIIDTQNKKIELLESRLRKLESLVKSLE